jgi:hypothetical protein
MASLICKESQQNEEKNIKTSPHGSQQFEHTPFRNTLNNKKNKKQTKNVLQIG